MTRKLDLNVVTKPGGNIRILSLKPGIGGNGQPGQSGRYGGWRGNGGLYTASDVSSEVYCLQASAGGVGGTGGGGGGAAGLAGQTIGIAFVLNQFSETDSGYKDNMTSDEKCNFLSNANINIAEGTYLNNVFKKPEECIVNQRVPYGGDGTDGYDGETPKAKEDANQPMVCDNTSAACTTSDGAMRQGNEGFGGQKPMDDDGGSSIYHSMHILIDSSYSL